MITMKDIAKGQEALQTTRYEDNRFEGDYEPIEFVKSDWDSMYKIDTDTTQDRLVEKVLVFKDTDAYLITATTTVFAGEKQVNFISQLLTLRGVNYFTKDLEQDFDWYYNLILQDNGYGIEIEDVRSTGEFMPEYGESTILRFKDDKDNFHTLTCNKFGQLSKITVKQSARKVNSNTSIQSAFD